ncbi:signal peptidase I [Pseudodesulfovibrio tunisiensis]|uniref:signal peptidase I n=1 Tax=Pseudodesulfovibrio tunisiensis TaxID=463192 RepID=UPI001FB42579|nr:signal peptidase I [Pseudodesulfovibrio tunisiensis]
MSGLPDSNSLEMRPRRPWLAGLLSFLVSGVGQVYNGQWKKGAVLFAIETVLGLVLIPACASFDTLVASFGALLALNMLVAVEAWWQARGLREYSLRSCNRGWIYGLVVLTAFTSGPLLEIVVRSAFYRNYSIPSGSMLPALHVGDQIMARAFGMDDPVRRGQVVVFELPRDPSKYFIKRVVGLPGERVELRRKVVFVNGKRLQEPYVRFADSAISPRRDNLAGLQLGPDEYFLMGDNRDASYDSRFFGPVPRSAFRASALYVYLPGGAGGAEWASRFGQTLNGFESTRIPAR